MIALCFSMCREIGENHEAAACIQLKLIESQPWGEHKSQQCSRASAARHPPAQVLRAEEGQETRRPLSTVAAHSHSWSRREAEGDVEGISPVCSLCRWGVISQEAVCLLRPCKPALILLRTGGGLPVCAHLSQ